MRPWVYLFAIIVLSSLLWKQDKRDRRQVKNTRQVKYTTPKNAAIPQTPPPSTSGRVTAIKGGEGWLIAGDEGGRIRLFKAQSGEFTNDWYAHAGPIRGFIIGAEDFYSIGQDGSVAWWTYTGQPKRRYRLIGHHLNDAVVLPDGGVIVAGDRGIVARIEGPLKWRASGVHGRATFSLALSPDGQHVASGGADGHVRVWSVKDGTEVNAWSAHTQWVRSVKWTKGGIWSAGTNGEIKRWTPEGKPRGPAFKSANKEIHSFAVTQNYLITSGTEAFVSVMNRRTGALERRVKVLTDRVYSVALLNNRLYTGDEDGTLTIRDVTNGKEIGKVRSNQ